MGPVAWCEHLFPISKKGNKASTSKALQDKKPDEDPNLSTSGAKQDDKNLDLTR